MAGPLSDVKVVELGGIGPVPHAGMMLADLGAEVIQIVRPGAAVGATDILHRGKRSVGLDLKRPAGVEVLLELVTTVDVLIEGFRPGVAERLGVGPEPCRERNPTLVYGRMTGWGQDGPLAGAAGHDIDYIAVAGALGAIGPADTPVPPLNLVGDFGGGSMLLLVGVLAALHQARSSGAGDVVDAAMVDGAALLMAMHHGGLAGGWWNGERGSDLFDGTAPFYTTYATSDGEWMAVGALEPEFYSALLSGLGIETEDLPAQMDRTGWTGLRQRFAEVFSTRSRREWEETFAGTDACVVGVYTMAEAPGHAHLRTRATFVEVDGIVQPAPAPRFSSGSLAPGPVPLSGSDTDAVLVALGYDSLSISRLRADGVIS